MDRLTYEISSIDNRHYDIPTNNIAKAINKLGKLEDVEGRLGISLLVLIEALEDGIYTHDCNYKAKHQVNLAQRRFESRCINDYGVVEISYYYFKDYGKKTASGWALTKEELE